MNKNQRVTEFNNQRSLHIDEMDALQIITLMNDEDHEVLHGVRRVLPLVAQAIDAIVERWQRGGRCFVVGAGTSGRLGVLDSVELPPTFSIDQERWIGFVAGGYEAMWTPLEENEDDEQHIVQELDMHSISAADVIIGVSASGFTPFTIAALRFGKERGCTTISISCNEGSLASEISDYGIEVLVGPEVIRGSTRLKAGSAQKMILNMLSTATMVRVGKVYQNQMVDMQLMNKKLMQRAVSTLMEVVHVSEQEARELLEKSKYNLKQALFIGMTQATAEEACFYLAQTGGRLKEALQRFFNK